MLNPEKLLGGLIRGGMRRRGGMGSLLTGGAALGLVGVAMEAAEHFMNRNQSAPATAGPPASGPPPMRAAVPPPPSGGPGPSAPPPPPSGAAGSTQPPDSSDNDALLLIRAMITAANADGVIDAQERTNILNKLQEVDLSQEEHQFIVHELLAPKDLDAIISAVGSSDLAQQVYMVSLLAIEVDTDAERTYLENLARRLGLDQAAVDRIHQQLGLP